MKNSPLNFFSKKGMTLIEILASIVILAIIIISFLPLFVQTSRSNSMSKEILDATYLAETEMEEIINMNTSTAIHSLDELSNSILAKGYQYDTSCSKCYGMNKDGYYVYIQLNSISNHLGKVVLRIYEDSNKNGLEAQMEMILSWEN